MTLRLVLERDDLQRVRLAVAPDPLWELVSALHMMQPGNPSAGWVDYHYRGSRSREAVSLLTMLAPRQHYSADFLTPVPVSTDIDAGCEMILRTSPARLAEDVAAIFADSPVPGWAKSLAAGDRDQLNSVVTAVRQGYRHLVAPEWHRVQHAVMSDRARRAGAVAAFGIEQLLATLPGVLSWDGAVLTVRCPFDRTVSLRGRGLTLLPSYFISGFPATLRDPELAPVLVYPAQVLTEPQPDVSAGLCRLLTRTRAECLRILLVPHSTSALARRLGVTVGTASKQTTVLCKSRLIVSNRDGAAVVHQTTGLGFALMVGSQSGCGGLIPELAGPWCADSAHHGPMGAAVRNRRRRSFRRR